METLTETIFGIPRAPCEGYPACKCWDGSCGNAHLKEGWKKCGAKIGKRCGEKE
jgi:hypothetical protein